MASCCSAWTSTAHPDTGATSWEPASPLVSPVWEYQTDVNAQGQVLNDGCGSVWSSGTVLPALGLVVYGTADCDFSADEPDAIVDTRLARHIRPAGVGLPRRRCPTWPVTGTSAPPPTPASMRTAPPHSSVVGGKDGTYYSLDPATGKACGGPPTSSSAVSPAGSSPPPPMTARLSTDPPRWATSAASRRDGQKLCDPSDPRDTAAQEPTTDSFDGQTGAVRWQADGSSTFAPTTVAGGMTFNGLALAFTAIQVRDAATGQLIVQLQLPQANWSGIATVGDALVFGLGSTYSPHAAGIEVMTPGGKPPVVPDERAERTSPKTWAQAGASKMIDGVVAAHPE